MIRAQLLRHWALHRSTLTLVASLAGFMASGPASAFPIGIACTGPGQFCNQAPPFSFTVSSASGATVKARFRAGVYICSNFRIHYVFNGAEVAVTGFVNNSQSTGYVDLGSFGPGTHTVYMWAEGEVSGCNEGTLLSWGGKLKIKQGP